jgi:GT2 family glycosyltransferase
LTETFPLVSIIIVNFNGKNLLEECLHSLHQIDYENYEVILVDNNSTDNSVEFTQNNFSNVKIIKLDQNYGYAIANNKGAKQAKGTFLQFLNNDTVVDKKYLRRLVQEIYPKPSIGIAQSMLYNPDGTIDSSGDFIDSLGIAFSSKQKINSIRKILSARGASMIIKRELFEKLGGFDEQFVTSFEDIDLGWRSWIQGYEVILVPSSIVYHKGGQTIKQLSKEVSFHGFKNQLVLRLTNFETSLAIKNSILFLIIYGYKFFRVFFDYKITGKTTIKSTKYGSGLSQKPNVMIILKGFFWIIKNLGYVRKKHALLESNRINSTKKLQKIGVILK